MKKNRAFLLTLMFMNCPILLGMDLGGQSKKIKTFAGMTKTEQNLFKAKNADAVTKALKAGADINSKNNEGVTPLFYWFDNFYVQGFDKKQDEFIKMLQVVLDAGAQTDITTKDETKTLIKWNRPLAQGVLDNVLHKERGNKKSEKLVKFLQENFKPLTVADKIDFLTKQKEYEERSANSAYFITAVNENDSNLIQEIMNFIDGGPLYFLRLILDNVCLSRPSLIYDLSSLIYYLLYQLHPTLKELQFIDQKFGNEKTSNLEKMYRKAESLECAHFTKVFDRFYEDLQSPIRQAVLSDNPSKLNKAITQQKNELSAILDGLELLASNYYLPVTFVPYLLYSLNLEVKDLNFLASNKPATDKAKVLQLLNANAKKQNNKAFGKALLDYYQKLRDFGGVLPEDTVREMLLFAGNPSFGEKEVKDEELIEIE